MRQLFLLYSQQQICQTASGISKSKKICQTVSVKLLKVEDPPRRFALSWSHYLKLMRIDDPNERAFYEIEAQSNHWSLRELQRQFDSSLYERLALSRNKKKVLELARRGQVVEKPEDAMKDPLVLEFTGLPEKAAIWRSKIMKAKSKTAVLKGGVTDPRLPGKVFFGPGAMQTGFILRKFREQVAEIGEELTARIKGTCFSAKGDDRGDEAKEFVRWIREKISAAEKI